MRLADLTLDNRRLFVVLCCALILRATAPLQAQQDVSSIEVLVQSGMDKVNDDVSSWEIAVQVQDDKGRRLKGAIVAFQIPPGAGNFMGGASLLTLVTDDNGRAVAHGFRRGSLSGPFQIIVTASYGRYSASVGVTQVNPKLSFMATPKKWYVIGSGTAAAIGLWLGLWLSQRSNNSTSISLGPGSVGPRP
jgi:hypothetical protein